MKQWVVVVGGTNMDVVARTSSPLVAATSNPGHTRISPGGVGRNVAACLGLLGAPVRLVSAVGDDAFGDEALRVTAACGADVTAVRRAPGATGTYTAVLDDRGELVAAVSDMAIVDELQLETVHLTDAALVVLDGNLAHAQAARVVAAAADAGVPLAFEPVSVAKAGAAGRPGARPVPRHAQQPTRSRPSPVAPLPTGATPSPTCTSGASSTSGCGTVRTGRGCAAAARSRSTCPPSRPPSWT